MTLEQLAAALAIVGILVGTLWKLFDVASTAKEAKAGVDRIDRERKEDKETWGKRLLAAENSAEATRNLGTTIQTGLEHLTERFASEIKHLADHSKEQTQLMRGELKEVASDVKGLMMERQPARAARRRGTGGN